MTNVIWIQQYAKRTEDNLQNITAMEKLEEAKREFPKNEMMSDAWWRLYYGTYLNNRIK